MNSRRDFLKAGSLAAIGSFTFLSGKNVFGQVAKKSADYFPLPAEIYSDITSSFGSETFKPLVNTSFIIKTRDRLKIGNERLKFGKINSTDVSLKLIEVVESENKTNQSGGKNGNTFFLIFEAENGAVLEDKIYQIKNPQTGEFPIFISTVGRSGKRYQAVFSRIYF